MVEAEARVDSVREYDDLNYLKAFKVRNGLRRVIRNSHSTGITFLAVWGLDPILYAVHPRVL